MSTTVIVSGARTSFGKLGGSLSGLTAAELVEWRSRLR